MKKLILIAVVAVAAIFGGVQTVKAEDCCCKPRILCVKKKVKTEEVCRRYFCETRCFLGCPRVIQFVEVTYHTTYCDSCGKESVEEWTKVYRCGVVKCSE